MRRMVLLLLVVSMLITGCSGPWHHVSRNNGRSRKEGEVEQEEPQAISTGIAAGSGRRGKLKREPVFARPTEQPPTAVASAPSNPIVRENRLPGTQSWKLSHLDAVSERELGIGPSVSAKVADDVHKQIKGYASATSVNLGQDITFYVTTNPPQPFTITVYRIGWYDGKGGRLVAHSGKLQGRSQPECPLDARTGLIECHWQPSWRLHVPTSWVSGYYLAKLTNSQGYDNYVPFVVRDDASHSDLLVQAPFTTYEAYNDYPRDHRTGKSLYEFNSYGPNTISGTTRAVEVSFDRPFDSTGADHFLQWDVYFITWVERMGYDVTYSTDVDTQERGDLLEHHKAFISIGHDEYWSRRMRENVQRARDAGVNLAFFGGNDVFRHIRFAPSSSGVLDRIIVCYKSARLDPVKGKGSTVNWPNPPVSEPEQTLIGLNYGGMDKGGADYVVTHADDWVYAGTGLHDGDRVRGLVGYEYDTFDPHAPMPPHRSYTLLADSPIVKDGKVVGHGNTSIYQAPSGAWVFDAGSIWWGWGLDKPGVADPRIERMTANILNRFAASRAR
ncbi:conserved hypothetical protein [Thermobaculum terrenum ATCC BAA-798]|uniref:N,N-dimethylformamidase beta subunit-like C-terminal domain-containing protein n=1 Tax=Thermobaculum terrenum (strain ATCC BAA-798 / CCMEE 7001 / YNP1) TaxID=525904 RepID=D1CIJ9_THET1|nr:N,N-dimethylformamidase beta subunit family domain-containing protein [Thermobaculum terrenum]ACZ43570.1 conserved hypothetical protein [Thermobaculum terrenum ATCC BAA-798]